MKRLRLWSNSAQIPKLLCASIRAIPDSRDLALDPQYAEPFVLNLGAVNLRISAYVNGYVIVDEFFCFFVAMFPLRSSLIAFP